jgi:alkylation response protein AidB-like acyl-CoA dehydrogenase
MRLAARHAGDDAVRDDVARAWIANEVVRLTTLRAQEMRERGTPGPEGAVIKLAYTTTTQSSWELCVDLLAEEGLLIDNYDMVRPTLMGGSALNDDGSDADVAKAFLTVRGSTIGGGTTDIGKNVLAERVLGLPPEPRVDKTLPWSEVPRS